MLLSKYSPGVLIGNWFEDTLKYVRKPLAHNSTYLTDFKNPGIIHIDDKEVWNQKLAGYGFDPRIIMFDSTKYLENYSSTYDLTYRHFTKGYKGPVLKSHRINCIEPFGNITQYGLKEMMQKKWYYDKNVPLISEYKENFKAPKDKDYIKIRAKPT